MATAARADQRRWVAIDSDSESTYTTSSSSSSSSSSWSEEGRRRTRLRHQPALRRRQHATDSDQRECTFRPMITHKARNLYTREVRRPATRRGGGHGPSPVFTSARVLREIRERHATRQQQPTMTVGMRERLAREDTHTTQTSVIVDPAVGYPAGMGPAESDPTPAPAEATLATSDASQPQTYTQAQTYPQAPPVQGSSCLDTTVSLSAVGSGLGEWRPEVPPHDASGRGYPPHAASEWQQRTYYHAMCEQVERQRERARATRRDAADPFRVDPETQECTFAPKVNEPHRRLGGEVYDVLYRDAAALRRRRASAAAQKAEADRRSFRPSTSSSKDHTYEATAPMERSHSLYRDAQARQRKLDRLREEASAAEHRELEGRRFSRSATARSQSRSVRPDDDGRLPWDAWHDEGACKLRDQADDAGSRSRSRDVVPPARHARGWFPPGCVGNTTTQWFGRAGRDGRRTRSRSEGGGSVHERLYSDAAARGARDDAAQRRRDAAADAADEAHPFKPKVGSMPRASCRSVSRDRVPPHERRDTPRAHGGDAVQHRMRRHNPAGILPDGAPGGRAAPTGSVQTWLGQLREPPSDTVGVVDSRVVDAFRRAQTRPARHPRAGAGFLRSRTMPSKPCTAREAATASGTLDRVGVRWEHDRVRSLTPGARHYGCAYRVSHDKEKEADGGPSRWHVVKTSARGRPAARGGKQAVAPWTGEASRETGASYLTPLQGWQGWAERDPVRPSHHAFRAHSKDAHAHPPPPPPARDPTPVPHEVHEVRGPRLSPTPPKAATGPADLHLHPFEHVSPPREAGAVGHRFITAAVASPDLTVLSHPANDTIAYDSAGSPGGGQGGGLVSPPPANGYIRTISPVRERVSPALTPPVPGRHVHRPRPASPGDGSSSEASHPENAGVLPDESEEVLGVCLPHMTYRC